MIENRMLIDSEWSNTEKQWIDPEDEEYRRRSVKRNQKRRIYEEEENCKNGENNTLSANE